MKKTILQIGCLCCLYITATTAPFLGVAEYGKTFSSSILMFVFFYELFFFPRLLRVQDFKIEIYIIAIFILYSLFKLIDKDFDAIKGAFFFMVFPMSISILMQIQTERLKISISRILIYFFLIECFLAIYEHLMHINIFPYNTEEFNPYVTVKDWEFRSSALLGHPLNNAVCISTLLGFILVSKFSDGFRILCLILGFIAILCFNARGATLVWIFLGFYYFYSIYKKQRGKPINKLFVFLGAVSIFSLIFYIFAKTSFGGRLANGEKLLDGSAQARIDVLSFFDFFKGYDLWFGNPSKYIPIMNKLKAGGIENSYIVILLNYGILFGLPLIFGLYKLINKYLRIYESTQQKIIIVSSFIIVGSFNNSLSDVSVWIIFILSICTFPCAVFYPEKEMSYEI